MISTVAKTRGITSLALGAFGKHPAWDDHVDQLGDQNATIDAFRVAFYDQGIGGNIDTGTWDDKPALSAHLRPFGHVVITGGGAEWIVARIWPSKDGRGRTRYPMVACVHVSGTGPDWPLTFAFPALEALEAQLLAATTQDQARAALASCRQRLAEQLRTAPDARSDQLIGPHAVARLADRPELSSPGPAGEPKLGWRRTLQQMHLELAPYGPGAKSTDAKLAQHLRVPIAADVAPERALAEVWSLMTGALAPGTPIGVIRPLADAWVDATIGPVSPSTLACLRLGTGKMALASQVPYDLEDAPINDLARVVLGPSGPNSSGEPARARETRAKVQGQSGAKSGERGWLWIALGLLGLIAVAVGILLAVR